MGMIGNAVSSVSFTTDIFSGDASTVDFVLSRAPASTASIAVHLSGIYQVPTNYTLSSTTLTFSSAPANGTNNITVLHLGTGSTAAVPSDGSVTTVKLAAKTGSGSVVLATSPTLVTPVLSGTTTGTYTLGGTPTITAPVLSGTTTGTYTLGGTPTITSPTISAPTITGVSTFAAGSNTAPALTTTGDTNTGVFFPAADTIAFTEGGVEAMRIDSSGNLQFNSGFGSVVTAYGCRAWVNFNGTGVVAIRASGNVSSITDNNVGDFTVNFTNAMPDVNYTTIGMCSDLTYGSATYLEGTTYSTTAVRLLTRSGHGATPATGDPTIACISVFR